MEGTMKCAIYHGAKNITVEERPIPQCGEKDVLVKVLRAGICGSDVGIYVHGGESYGLQDGCQFGHEMSVKSSKKAQKLPMTSTSAILFSLNPSSARNMALAVP